MFKLKTDLRPKGDQPDAIKKLVDGIKRGKKEQVLLGATGTGKTFTMANVIQKTQKQTLIIVHNKTLAMQLFQEMKNFFPENDVEYYVSYFDYYRPEAYKPQDDLYIGKKVQRNKDISRMRMKALNSLITKEKAIVVSSVAAIYGCLSPLLYKKAVFSLKLGDKVDWNSLEKKLIFLGYKKKETIGPGEFFISQKNLQIMVPWGENLIEFTFNNRKVSKISKLEKSSLRELRIMEEFSVPPGQDYVGEEGGCLNNILKSIRKEKNERIKQLKKEKKFIESERLRVRVENDLRSIREIGYCSGIENYSRYFDGRKEGETPYVLLDYLSKDFLIIVDESHITIPQIKAMYNTNLKRLDNLVEYGFRLPSSKDNRPLNIEEFFQKINSIIYVSATPGSFEIGRVEGEIVEQIIRPTGLVDPEIEIRNSEGQIRDIIKEIDIRAIKGEKVLIYALTISMSEEIADYLRNRGVKVVYLHSKMEVFERYQAITSLRRGIYDVIVGINLLKEGIDMPEVSLVCIIDADKSGFLRNFRSLIQIIGRAARNKNGRVIFYADSITEDMKSAIEETKRRREIQKNHNLKNSIIPKTIEKPIKDIVIDEEMSRRIEYATKGNLNEEEYEKLIKSLRKEMKSLAKQFKFDQAISLRNSIADLERKDYKFSRKILSRKKH